MEINEGDIRRVLETYLSAPQNELSPDEIRSLVIALLNQNMEVKGKSEDLDASAKLEDRLAEVSKQLQRVAGEMAREEDAKASAISPNSERKAKVAVDIVKAEAEPSTEDVIQEIFKAETMERLAIIHAAIESAKAEAEKAIHDARREAESLRIEEWKPATKEPPSAAKEQGDGVARRDERQQYPSIPRRREKGIVRYGWNVEIERQQHKIEILLSTSLGLFATGAGRLLVDGETVDYWGCNPFRLIPQGVLKFRVAGTAVFIRSRGRITEYPVLLLGDKEIPAVSYKL